MKFKLKREDLIRNLSFNFLIANTKVKNHLQNCVKFHIDNDKLILLSTNDSISVRTELPIQSESKDDNYFFIEVFQLVKLLNFIDDDEILLEKHKNLNLITSTGKYEFPIKGNIELPKIIFNQESDLFQLKSNELLDALKKIDFILKQDVEYKPELNNLLFEIDSSNRLNLVSCDGKSLGKINIKSNFNNEQINYLIPKETIKVLTFILSSFKIDNMDVLICFGNNKILIKIDDVQILSVLYNKESYVDYNRIIPSNSNYICEFNKKELINPLNKILSVIDGKSKPINLSFKNNKVKISTTNQSKYQGVEELNNTNVKGDFSIYFDGIILSNILKTIDESDIIMKFTNEKSNFIIEPKDNSNIFYLMVPLLMIN